MCLSSSLDLISKRKGIDYDDRIYLCRSCKQYWFFQWWEDELDAEWIIKTGDTEWGEIHEDFFPITNNEFIQLEKKIIDLEKEDKGKRVLSHKIFRSNKWIYSFRKHEWKYHQ